MNVFAYYSSNKKNSIRSISVTGYAKDINFAFHRTCYVICGVIYVNDIKHHTCLETHLSIKCDVFHLRTFALEIIFSTAVDLCVIDLIKELHFV